MARLGIEYPVLIDRELELWRDYENQGWPARYLFDGRARLFEYHYGEGAYVETELAIQELLGVEREVLDPVRPEDAPDAQLVPQTQDQEGAYSGPYEAGGVWAVLDGSGTVRVKAQVTDDSSEPAFASELQVSHPGAFSLIEHERHTAAAFTLELRHGRAVPGNCFTPGWA